MDNNHSQSRFRNRILDMYSDLISLSHSNFRQTNYNIQQIEGGLRELLRNDDDYIQSNIHVPVFNNNDSININRNINRNRNVNINNDHVNYNSLYTSNDLRQQNTSSLPIPPNSSVGSRNIRRPYSIWTPRGHHRPTAELFTRVFSNAFNTTDNLTPVIVTPSLLQISNATENITLNEVSGNICPITQTHFQESDRIARIRHCGHCFVESSLHSWFERSVRCPVCRYDIRDYVTPEQPNNNEATNETNNGMTNSMTNGMTNDATNDTTTETSNRSNSNLNVDVSNNSNTIEPSIENMVNIFTTQVANTLRDYVTNNVSNGNDDPGNINFEYVIQTPTNTYTTSSAVPTNTASTIINNLFTIPNSNNVNISGDRNHNRNAGENVDEESEEDELDLDTYNDDDEVEDVDDVDDAWNNNTY